MSRTSKPSIFGRGNFNYGLAKSLGLQNLFMFDRSNGILTDLMNPSSVTASMAAGLTSDFRPEGSILKCDGSTGTQHIVMPAGMVNSTGAGLVVMARIKATATQAGNPAFAFGYGSTSKAA